MEELSVTGKAATEEISQLRANLDHKAVVHSHRYEELEKLRGKLKKKGLEVLKRDSKM